jgi:hypothetical protein
MIAQLTAAQKALEPRRARGGDATIGDFGAEIAGAAKHRGQARAAAAAAAGQAAPRKPRVTREPRYNAYRGRAGGEFWIERKGDRAHRRLATFATREELHEFYRRPDYREVLARAWVELREQTNVTDGKVRGKRNLPRVGPDYRDGVDVTPERFMEVFAPYGVQFGNWQRDRAACLNQAHDALRDLAGFLGLAPEAIAFGGLLGLAFGARGKGKAAAHYEPLARVINLTKTNGAGCLAHEWFHAWDHNACATAGLPGLTKTAALEKAVRNLPREYKVRSKEADRTRTKKYWSEPCELLARAFERWVRDTVENDYLANILKLEAFGCGEKRYPYPLPAEMEQVDRVFRELFGLDQ